MLAFNIETKQGKKTKKHKVTLPLSWDEMSYRKMVDIETVWDRKSIVRLFSILCGVPFDEIATSTQKDLDERLLTALAYVFDSPKWMELKPPSRILLDGEIRDIPTDLSKETLFQKIYVTQLLQNENVFNVIPKAISCYMQPVIDGKFNEERVGKWEDEIWAMPALTVFAVGNFFLTRLKRYRKDMLRECLVRTTRMRNLLTSKDSEPTET